MIIHSGQYTAEFEPVCRVLTITRPKGGGVYLEGDKATQWADAIETATDKREANALCRALVN